MTSQTNCLRVSLRHVVLEVRAGMNRQQHDVTEAELALLQSLWDAGPATIRQLVDRVYKQEGRVGLRDGSEAARSSRIEGVRRARSGWRRCTCSGRPSTAKS